MAFTVEDGSIVANANSYVSISYANTYFTDRGSPTDWADAYEYQRKAALIYATTWLDQNFSWYSFIQDSTQELGWPRGAYLDREGRTIGGTGVIPTQIKNATCEIALAYLKDDFTSTDNEGVKSEAIGDTSITYSKSTKSYSFVKMSLSDFGSPRSNVVCTYRA